jgi:ParB-like chromosome segregation protein Spo0J
MAEIKNRIVGSGEEQLDQIMFNPRNWRIHPLSQQDALKGVLEEVGWVQQVIVNKRTGNLIDGHLRCQLAAREGAKTIPVVYVDVSEDEEALVLATLDPIGAMAATDKQKLDELFQDINSDNENVQKMIAEIAEKEGVLGDLPTLDDLESKFGEPNERDFWPIVRVQVSPDTYAKFTKLMASTPGEDEAEKFDAIVSGSL